MKLMVAEKTIKAVFVVRDDSSFGERCEAADQAITDHIQNMSYYEADMVSVFKFFPEGWNDGCLPYDPQDLCETEMTIKEIREMEK